MIKPIQNKIMTSTAYEQYRCHFAKRTRSISKIVFMMMHYTSSIASITKKPHPLRIAACAAASRAMGTRNGEQLT